MPKGFRSCPDCCEHVPLHTKVCPGCFCSMRGWPGRPRGSSSEKDYGVGREGKRPFGTTAEREFGVGKEGGRPEGTMAERGIGVGREGGRSEGTMTERRVEVGREGGRPEGTSERAWFKVGGQARPSVCLHIMWISGCVKHFPQPGAKIHYMPSKYLRVRLHS